MWEISPEHQETFFHCEVLRALAQVTQRDGGVCLPEIFKSHLDMVPGNWLLVALLEEGSWTR